MMIFPGKEGRRAGNLAMFLPDTREVATAGTGAKFTRARHKGGSAAKVGRRAVVNHACTR